MIFYDFLATFLSGFGETSLPAGPLGGRIQKNLDLSERF